MGTQPIKKKIESIKIIINELKKETNNLHNIILIKKNTIGFCNIPKPLNNVSVLLNLTTIEKLRQYYHNNEDANQKIIRLANDEKIRHKQGLIKMSSIPCRSLPKPTSVVENRKNINNIARENEILFFKNETSCITELENMTSPLMMQKKTQQIFQDN